MKTSFGYVLLEILMMLMVGLYSIWSGHQEGFSLAIGVALGVTACSINAVPDHLKKHVIALLVVSAMCSLVVPVAYLLSEETLPMLLSWASATLIIVFLILGFFWNTVGLIKIYAKPKIAGPKQ